MNFESFPKIPRLSREVIVTCKIDGTNASVCITPTETPYSAVVATVKSPLDGVIYDIRAGSRNRWITPAHDNFGFAKWVVSNAYELVKLGPGRHFGEWWGAGIQRGYGLTEKRFSLFNVDRWGYPGFCEGKQESCPNCCHMVPVLYSGDFDTAKIEDVLRGLAYSGSVAAPGFMQPEGVVIYHTASGTFFKKTIDHDGMPKGKIP